MKNVSLIIYTNIIYLKIFEINFVNLNFINNYKIYKTIKMNDTNIIIDERIRNWVFIPLIFVMFLVAVIRFYINIIINNKKRPPAIKSMKQA